MSAGPSPYDLSRLSVGLASFDHFLESAIELEQRVVLLTAAGRIEATVVSGEVMARAVDNARNAIVDAVELEDAGAESTDWKEQARGLEVMTWQAREGELQRVLDGLASSEQSLDDLSAHERRLAAEALARPFVTLRDATVQPAGGESESVPLLRCRVSDITAWWLADECRSS